MKKIAAQLQIGHRIHLVGEVDVMDAYDKLADVTLLTSLSESFPYVLLESARMQIPIITTEKGDVGALLDGAHKG